MKQENVCDSVSVLSPRNMAKVAAAAATCLFLCLIRDSVAFALAPGPHCKVRVGLQQTVEVDELLFWFCISKQARIPDHRLNKWIRGTGH